MKIFVLSLYLEWAHLRFSETELEQGVEVGRVHIAVSLCWLDVTESLRTSHGSKLPLTTWPCLQASSSHFTLSTQTFALERTSALFHVFRCLETGWGERFFWLQYSTSCWMQLNPSLQPGLIPGLLSLVKKSPFPALCKQFLCVVKKINGWIWKIYDTLIYGSQYNRY